LPNACRQAFVDSPATPLGLYDQPVANDLVGMVQGLILFTGIRRLDDR
jgi:hypothetical protein